MTRVTPSKHGGRSRNTKEKMRFTGSTSPGLASIPSELAKIVVCDREFEMEDSQTTSSVLGKLRKAEDGSYRFSDEWDVRPTQFTVLFDHLYSAK
jgi:hypothetical protein